MNEAALFRAYGVDPASVTATETVRARETPADEPIGPVGVTGLEPAPAGEVIAFPDPRRMLGLPPVVVAKVATDGR